MMVAHLAGMPLEELLAPLIAGGGSVALALRVALARWRSGGRPLR
jgi:hypothetical protein